MVQSYGRYIGYSITQCENCEHCFKWGDGGGRGWLCHAFPTGIPLDIIKGKTSHEVHIEGDNGYKYKARVYKDLLGTYYYTFGNKLVKVSNKKEA
jgi:hypothetical protein